MRTAITVTLLFVASALVPLAHDTTASHAGGPSGANAIVTVHAFADRLPTEPTYEVDWVGVGGPNEDTEEASGDCASRGPDGRLSNSYRRHPPVVLKQPRIEERLVSPTSVASAELTALCKATIERLPVIGFCEDPTRLGDPEGCHTYANEPQHVGIGAVTVGTEQRFIARLDFGSAWIALGSPTMLSCRVDASRAQFLSTRSQGVVGLEPVLPSEHLVGPLQQGSCIDQSAFIAGANGGSIGGGDPVPLTTPDPDFDMGAGLWAVCIEGTLRNNLGNLFITVNDYSWFWIDSTGNNLGLSEHWSSPATWDSDSYGSAAHPNDCRNVDGKGGGFPF